MFKFKIEAYLFAICRLNQLNQKYKSSQIAAAIESIKVAVENHEQNPAIVTRILKNLTQNSSLPLLKNEKLKLEFLAEKITNNKYSATEEEKFENPISRRLESQLQIELLQDPTPAMMISVSEISNEILKVIEQLEEDNNQRALNHLLDNLTEQSHPIAFGAFKNKPKLSDVKKMLQGNDPAKLTEIMFIHFKFAQSTLRSLNITTAPKRKPTGKLLDIVQNYESLNGKKLYLQNPDDFFIELDSKKTSLIPDQIFYNSILYRAEHNRGRLGSLLGGKTNAMGLMLYEQKIYDHDLPKHTSQWGADAKFQLADLDSSYVKDLTHNDAVYIAGPSGMTSLFLGQMECLGNFDSIQKKQHYLVAVTAYMVAGGFHSLHEVLGPAEYGLNLVPGYNVEVPNADKLAAAPNFHQFYKQQITIDTDFVHRRNMGWSKLINYCNNHYFHPRMVNARAKQTFNSIYHSIHDSIKEIRLTATDPARVNLASAGLNAIKEAKKLVDKDVGNVHQLTKIIKDTHAIVEYPENKKKLNEYKNQAKKMCGKRDWYKIIGGAMLMVTGAALIVCSGLVAAGTFGLSAPVSALGTSAAVGLISSGIGLFSAYSGRKKGLAEAAEKVATMAEKVAIKR